METEKKEEQPDTRPAPGVAATPEQVWDALKEVQDPELHIDIISLGLVYNIEVRGSDVDIEMTLTTPGCPYGPQLLYAVDYAARALPGVEEVSINVVWVPPWSPEKMTEEAKLELGFDI